MNDDPAATGMPSPVLAPNDARVLLDRLCIGLGFCLPPDEIARLVESPPREVDAFTDAVFRAEGLDPETADRTLYRQVRDVVADAFWRSRIAAEPPE